MKVEQEKEPFRPVTITLETQDEVDQLAGVSNLGVINDTVPLGCKLYNALIPYRTSAFREVFEAVNAALIAHYRNC